jgi:peptidoglycan/LPS O-acetylase OafA/YrhL
MTTVGTEVLGLSGNPGPDTQERSVAFPEVYGPRPVADETTGPRPISEPPRGTRKRLDHIDAMRPVKQAGVVSTHSLLAFAPVATTAVGSSLLLLHVTREAFLFVSACMLTYSYRDLRAMDLRLFVRRRFSAVGVPYLCWTVIYFLFTLQARSEPLSVALGHLGYLVGTGYYQLYYLVVLAQFYVFFPLLLMLVRRTDGHHRALLIVSGALQVLLVSLMHWGLLPWWSTGFWASREVTSYQFYLVVGMVVALHLDDVHDWLCRHVRLVVGFTVLSAVCAEGWFFLAAGHVFSFLGSSSDPFQPAVIPFNVGAIACIYLVGVVLVDRRRSKWTRAIVRSGSDNAYGVYLAQMIFITLLARFGWRDLETALPWPVLSVITVVIVFLSCVALTAVLARTSLARALTGRTRVPWRVWHRVPSLSGSSPGAQWPD